MTCTRGTARATETDQCDRGNVACRGRSDRRLHSFGISTPRPDPPQRAPSHRTEARPLRRTRGTGGDVSDPSQLALAAPDAAVGTRVTGDRLCSPTPK